MLAPAGQIRLWHETLIRDSGLPDPISPDAAQWDVHALPPEVVPVPLASRYCETDQLGNIAWDLFGNTPPGWGRVQAVCDWVHANIHFGYEFAHPSKTAFQVYQERKGVCRDFSHLLIAFLRCLNIPARYVTGYLGDIGVPLNPDPMDFSAWTEVFLDGRWYTFDARHNMPAHRQGGHGPRPRRGRCRHHHLVRAATLKKFSVTTDAIPFDEDTVPRPRYASVPAVDQIT